MVAILAILVIVVFGFIGLIQWVGADLPLAIREMAVNSRKEGSSGSAYGGIQILSVLMKVLAVLTWIVGLVLAVAGPSQMERFF
jgi:hypothetical protein